MCCFKFRCILLMLKDMICKFSVNVMFKYLFFLGLTDYPRKPLQSIRFSEDFIEVKVSIQNSYRRRLKSNRLAQANFLRSSFSAII